MSWGGKGLHLDTQMHRPCQGLNGGFNLFGPETYNAQQVMHETPIWKASNPLLKLSQAIFDPIEFKVAV